MATRCQDGTKRKKGFTVHEISDNPGPSGGYIETHTEYGRQEGSLMATTSSINIPPSPTKPAARKKERSPFLPPALAPETDKAHGSLPDVEPEGPYDVLWVENESDIEEDLDQDSDEGRKRKRGKTVEVSPPPMYGKLGADCPTSQTHWHCLPRASTQWSTNCFDLKAREHLIWRVQSAPSQATAPSTNAATAPSPACGAMGACLRATGPVSLTGSR
jgi:hypothetical protein